jgi:hypothetical protein
VGVREEEETESVLSGQDELARDALVGVDIISQFDNANWWSWKEESTLFFGDGHLENNGNRLEMECGSG